MKPIKFIVDIGSNHNQDANRIWKLIKTAKEIGADAVKFQLFSAERLYAPEFTLKRAIVASEALPAIWIPSIRNMCNTMNLEFHCTPFDIDCVAMLAPYVDELKIGAYEILNHRLIQACADTGLPLSISVGNATRDEYINAVESISVVKGAELYLYWGVPKYPTNALEANLWMIRELRRSFFHEHVAEIGYSDHTRSVAVINRAIVEGARRIEFHLDLDDQKGAEYNYGHCWEADAASYMIDTIRRGEAAGEKTDLDISEEMKWRMDPEDGMRPMRQYRGELRRNKNELD